MGLISRTIASHLPKTSPLQPNSAPRPDKPLLIEPGLPLPASIRIAANTNPEKRAIRDGHGIGTLKLLGTRKRSVATFPVGQIKRVRLLKHADGYYVQCAVKVDRTLQHAPTGRDVGIDVGLKTYYTASDGQMLENPRLFRKAEKNIKRLQRRLARKKKGSKNQQKARKKLAKAHLKVSRQRRDFACKQASALVSSSDLIAYEDLHIRSLAKNRKLAKSIMDASWGLFLGWVRYYGAIHGIPVVAVSPNYTTQDCSGCGRRVKKSLSVRTHFCPSCGLILDRDLNAALNILFAAYRTLGHRETGRVSDSAQRLGTDAPLLSSRKRRQ